MPPSEKIFLGESGFCKYNHGCFNLVISCKTFSSFYNSKLAVVIYNAQKSFNFDENDTSTKHLPGLAWYFIWDCLCLWFCLLALQALYAPLYTVFDVCIHLHLIHWLLAKSLDFSMPIWLMCNCSSVCPCNVKGMINLLPFITMPSITASSCLICQYFCMPCLTLSLLCGQPCIM